MEGLAFQEQESRFPQRRRSQLATLSPMRQRPDSRARRRPRRATRCGALLGLPIAHPLQTSALICLLALALGAPHPATGNAGGAWDAGTAGAGAGAEVQVWSHQLMMFNFTDSLTRASEPWAIVEFFASWCPACMHFKPHYEKVARVFNDPASPAADFIYMAKVDCAVEGELCQRFSIMHYPTMLWARPSEIAVGSRTARSANKEFQSALQEVECDRNADGLLAWINKRTNKSFSFNAQPSQPQPQQQQAIEGHQVVAVKAEETGKEVQKVAAAYSWQSQPKVALLSDMEEATAVALHHIFTAVRLDGITHAPLSAFLDLITTYHPSQRCRLGSSALQEALGSAWPSPQLGLLGRKSKQQGGVGGLLPNVSTLQPLSRVCGAHLPSGSWVQCKGSISDRRGYTCGLWLLFHSLSVRLPESDPNAGRRYLGAIHDFVAHFFACGPCRQHFLAMAKTTGMRRAATKKQAVLWLWRAHNMVNARLAKEEAESGGTRGDPQFPKHQWPLPHQCPSCRVSPTGAAALRIAEDGSGAAGEGPVEWDETAVYQFLEQYYAQPGAGGTGSGEAGAGSGEVGAAANGGQGGGVLTQGVKTQSGGGASGEGVGKGSGAGGGGEGASNVKWVAMGLVLAGCIVYAVVRGSDMQRGHHALPSAARRRKYPACAAFSTTPPRIFSPPVPPPLLSATIALYLSDAASAQALPPHA